MSTPDSPVEWRADGLPGSRLYGDVYFSSEDGLAESRAVFLAGCGLPGAWANRRQFTVGELGFGAGLNIAALLTLWAETRPAGAHLSIFSIEAHPMAAADAARALARWPDIQPAAAALIAGWPGPARGFHHLDLPAFGASLDLAVMDAAEALTAWSGQADAWFLDGFAPAANPAMWSPPLMAQVAARSAPGARAATFTVAGAVRRGLAEAGFAVSKQPGFGRKRERTEAVFPGQAAEPPRPSVAIVGAGIAGAALARALRARGLEPQLFDGAGPAAGASGNPAALMTPRLDAGDGPPARLFAQAFRHAVAAYGTVPGAILARGARHLADGEKDAARHQRIAASPLHDPGTLTPEPGGLIIHDGLVLDAAQLVQAWSGPVDRRAVAELAPSETGWRLLDAAGQALAEVDAVVLCAGADNRALAQLPLQPVRGQCTVARGAAIPQAVSFGGYAVPTRDGVLFGATHQRDRTDTTVLAEDDQANLALIATRLPDLAADLAARPLSSRAAIRAATPDHLPLAGPVPGRPGLFVLSGFGGRGFCVAPLLADHLAATLLGYPSPLPADLADAVDPDRFRQRALKRTSPSPAR
ncbi:FAD-dependent 5-carboxymethylaminomethyl-2-thiouridine(34) oxidoreductase MnmC [Caulobacter sp. NIBR1757]|uniref:FAD-dependent 5-carboxymethylaminomethyl-2-thiouridine(34) oxidoreductase MnmC n=1 Tax=Caulobacter sp. NIBR1757 TaxID=3016000 RepID=UPI0022F12DDB|nr:FAD-dependent 5-carboxymethylaminomethyl-2-thiouridine(34) oxidoreductase MnmC [Caulobacter sp. NIBR1757]